AIASPDPKKRVQAVQFVGFAQEADKLPALQKRLEIETHADVRRALREAIAVTQLKDADDAVKLAALNELKELHTLSSHDVVRTAMREAEARGATRVVEAAQAVLKAIEDHKTFINLAGTFFRGLSL